MAKIIGVMEGREVMVSGKKEIMKVMNGPHWILGTRSNL